jgi:hypothetical protein
MIKGLSGYATLTHPTTGCVREADTFTCGHCQRIVHVRPKEPLENLGGRCGVCDALICPACVKQMKCTPFEKKLERMERREQFRKML